MSKLEIFTVSSLEKVFAGVRPSLYESENSCFKNEVFSFQVAFCETERESFLDRCSWKISGSLKDYVTVRTVDSVYCSTPRGADADDYYLTHTACAVPDILRDDGFVYLRYKQWGALWVTVQGDLPVGRQDVRIAVVNCKGEECGCAQYTLNVIDACLPDCGIKYAHWFHYDSLAAYYGEEMFSPRFYEIMRCYIVNAVRHGVNTLLVPLFTPPLNTTVGGERTTVQLVDVHKGANGYTFDFSRLGEFMRFAEQCGIRYYEMSHLYTQWGARNAPKIMGRENGKYKQLFGWQTDALGNEYVEFVTSFLSQLVGFLRGCGYGADRCFFHISDEPNAAHIEHYLKLRAVIKPVLGDYPIFDALSAYGFYARGAVDIPVVSTDKAAEFAGKAENMWVYYCCGQGVQNLSNRFISMPLQRTRILGFQLWLNRVKGFLHWGYNYYNSALSERFIDPYQVNDADGSFQSGDSFIVYPARGGYPLDSLRHEAMQQALSDYSAMCLVERKIGRTAAEQILICAGMNKDFVSYPPSALWHISLRKKINEIIANN